MVGSDRWFVKTDEETPLLGVGFFHAILTIAPLELKNVGTSLARL